MCIEFKNYQERAIVKLKQETNELLDMEGNKVCVFKSPTGSGKTLMVAEFLKRLIDSRIDGKRFSFVWIAVNKLHDQSKNNLKKYYDRFGVGIRCSYFEDLNERKISENEILFLNWASINKKDNIYIRANERDNNLTSIIDRTKNEGRQIILIIDESHHTAKSDKSKELIDEIGPKVTIEVSATPQLTTLLNRIVEVEVRDVKDEGMIKKEVAINPGFELFNKKISDKTADEFVLEAGLKMRQELARQYEDEGVSTNPLMLIQIPDSRQGLIDKKDALISTLLKYGITTDNGKLAIYLSDKDNKINLENIEKNENEVEVMIFKQAIALGWDCPRACILVLFREWHEENLEFSIQTIGRIMRMPEQKHYDNHPDLNIGYVFTSLSDIQVAEDIARDYITVHEGKRNNELYEDIDLTSYHFKRFREETRLSSDFLHYFLEAGKELDLKSKISEKHSIVDTKLIASGKIEDVDKETKTVEKKGTFSLIKNEVDLQNAFDMFARENLTPYAPELRSIKRINDSIYRFFGVQRNEDEWPKIQAITLAEENKQYFIDTINRAKELYQHHVGRGKTLVLKNEKPWNIPTTINYNLNFTIKNYKKSIITPYYAKTKSGYNLSMFEEDSQVEVDFIAYLEKAKKVKWWFKNGTSDATYFAVSYFKNEQEKCFYVDFVIMLNDGTIVLADTKSGWTAEDAKEKAEGLAKYIKEENEKGKNLMGGIVISDKGSWRYNDKSEFTYDKDNLKDWKFLELG